MKIKTLLTPAFALLLATGMKAEVTLPKVLCSNMVLQRSQSVPVWGNAEKGEKVTVKFAGQTKTAVADTAGKWKVMLAPMKVSAKPATMTIKGKNSIVLKNILVGDVWLCSGQSNMEYPLNRNTKRYKGPQATPDIAAAELQKTQPDNIRYFYVEKNYKPNEYKTKGWVNGNDSVLNNLSAIGYFFAQEIQKEVGVPIGIMSISWGGTRVEQWTPEWAYEQSPLFKAQASTKDFKIDGMHPGQMFHSMLEPVIPFVTKGVLWYQGESNLMVHDSLHYCDKFKLMVDTWRNLFGVKEWPFYYVQIAPHYYTHRTKDRFPHDAETLPITWEAQAQCLKIPFTGMAVTTDLVDSLKDIHPWNKWDVAHRLALVALANSYGKNIEYSGPVYKSMKVLNDKIYLSFDHIGSGLISKDGQPLTWFTVAGEDGKFVNAEARIENNQVVISSLEVKSPKNVRFGWNETAQSNFFNKEGLPASPFRTDAPVWKMK
jgi:Domain of unknown function (DUF303).